ncbi:plexin domain containing lethal (1) G0289 [Brevipalpus obovatus]|uniref:plexin domain containing lethal (1) G0289 n=1 Tax=Brevipalpus obovatus TaxID=246614 RepID=UPI003D9E44A1
MDSSKVLQICLLFSLLEICLLANVTSNVASSSNSNGTASSSTSGNGISVSTTPNSSTTSLSSGTIVSSEYSSDNNNGGSPVDNFPPDFENNSTFFDTHNLTRKTDHHVYYNSTIYYNPEEAMNLWIDLNNASSMVNVTIHDMLSESYRRAATVNLTFEFPFYGLHMRNVTIATGGFLYLGDPVHSWLAATQYIAPLMANFDTRNDNSSFIKYADNGSMFVVEWENVHLKDRKADGDFTFQAILHKNGDIAFIYKDLPIPIKDIHDIAHPVKVGLSDAYVIDKTAFFIRKKTIYEYHRAEMKNEKLSNQTAIYLTALPTCTSSKTCEDCTDDVGRSFNCRWCESIKRCSDGVDRQRQDWIKNDCDHVKIDTCPVPSNTSTQPDLSSSAAFSRNGISHRQQEAPTAHSPSSLHQGIDGQPKTGSGKVGFITMMMMVSLVSGVVLWLLYAYKNPQSSSGQFLIKYRPAQWRLSGSEARYTAASIHM